VPEALEQVSSSLSAHLTAQVFQVRECAQVPPAAAVSPGLWPKKDHVASQDLPRQPLQGLRHAPVRTGDEDRWPEPQAAAAF
jgi:hypothetical protein